MSAVPAGLAHSGTGCDSGFQFPIPSQTGSSLGQVFTCLPHQNRGSSLVWLLHTLLLGVCVVGVQLQGDDWGWWSMQWGQGGGWNRGVCLSSGDSCLAGRLGEVSSALQ